MSFIKKANKTNKSRKDLIDKVGTRLLTCAVYVCCMCVVYMYCAYVMYVLCICYVYVIIPITNRNI